MAKKRRKRRLVICPYCDKRAELRDSKIIYGRSYGNVWICRDYPDCDSYVGCHRGVCKPLGRMANAELREWKKKAHAAFDPLWRNGSMTRKEAYLHLQELMGMSKSEAHIGKFDVEDCKKLVALMENEQPRVMS